MKTMLLTLTLVLFSISALAETCYQISAIENGWSRTPEMLCIEQPDLDVPARIELKTGLPFADEKVVTVFHLDLLRRSRCLDCNQDIYGLLNPSNSSFNTLSIRFDGTRDLHTFRESGQVFIGTTRFFYQSL